MANRVSGTVTLAPQSGDVTSSGTNGNITQSSGGTTSVLAPLTTFGTSSGGLVHFLNSTSNVGSYVNPTGSPLDPATIDQGEYSTTAERQLAGAYFSGGVGIEQDLSVGGFIYGRIAKSITSTTSSNVVIQTTNNNAPYYPLFVSAEGLVTQGATLYADNTNRDNIIGDGGLEYNPALGLLTTEQVLVDSTITSTSTTTGALIVQGGVGIAQDINIGGNIFPSIDNINEIGRADRTWASAYLETVYSKLLANSNTNITISPNNGINNPDLLDNGLVDIYGNIKVRGTNPIGTAPVVTNVLYVTMDGDDTNDGRAQDASRACRTISGAVRSPYYQSGTQIKVSPGRYLENNPIEMKPYTSIMGSDLRTTSIEPINKTQDLFHVNSGCYLNYMQFTNGRSGLLPGNYEIGYNRGAYATAFPPLTGNNRIDVFHSPYIQNCTNQSGPWLKDGTMFVPDETVQVPIVAGTGSWDAGTSTLVVSILNEPINGFINAGPAGAGLSDYGGPLLNKLNFKGTTSTSALLPTSPIPTLLDAYTATDTGALWVYTGARTVQLGMSVAPGQQNQGFFNARSLMLANKPFLQAQVVSYIDQTFNSGVDFATTNPYYNSSTCARDVGLIVDAISMDMLYGSTSDSTFAGLQYWNHGTYTGQIPSEITATTAAIVFLKGLAQGYVTPSDQGPVGSLFDNITNILTNGVGGITDSVQPEGLPSNNATIVSDYNLLQANKANMQAAVIDYITTNYPSLQYSTSTCIRDVGYIIDSVSFDLLHSGNLQSIKSGVYYYGYNSGSTAIPSEILQTTAAYQFINTIIPKIITGQIIANPYQTAVKQVIDGTPASADEIRILQDNLDVITAIITDGPNVASAKTPQNLTKVSNPNVLNAWNYLQANRSFIQAEVVAFIATVFSGTFVSNQQKSYRDTGILIENVAYDIAFGGNQKSVESGLSFWNGPVSYIANSIFQCTAAINYLNNLIQAVILNAPCPVLTPVAGIPQASQVINTVMTNGQIANTSIAGCFNIITNIINQGPSVAPVSYTSAGPDAAYVSAEILMQANRQFIQENTLNYINWNLVQPQPAGYLPFNQIKCARDTGIIVDSLAADLLYPTTSFSQSTFSGLQYYAQNGYTGYIGSELTTTTAAISYLQTIAAKVIQNITTATDAIVGITRYSTATQYTSIEPATQSEVNVLNTEFGIILSILGGNTTGWTDKVIANSAASNLLSVQDAYNNLLLNKSYMQEEVYQYIVSPSGLNYSPSSFNTSTCKRDIGYIINSVAFDLLHGGNRQAIQSGLSYYQQNPSVTLIPKESTATTMAFTFLGTVIDRLITGVDYSPLQIKVAPVLGLPVGSASEVSTINAAINTLTNIVTNGPTGYSFSPINITASATTSTINAYNILEANRSFLVAETLAWLNKTYNSGAFYYNQEKCYRDIGLMVDAVSQDIALGGNQRSVEAGLSYWSLGTNVIASEVSTTTAAISYIADICQQIIANQPVAVITGTNTAQVINTFFQYGGNYMPQQAVARGFNIISSIIAGGPSVAPPVYEGSGLIALTGVNADDVKISPTVTYISTISTGTYLLGLSQPTIGFGNNATLYFGDTYVWPLQDAQVESISLIQTGGKKTWDSRKIDAIGGMGGSLVDGAVVSDRSPIQSFVYDAYTQVTQGGKGIHITNNGYAQLVSVFTIFSSIGVQVDNGGIASIVNSNANFGDLCLVAKGYGFRAFSGTVFNPPNRAYPFSPVVTGSPGLDPYYPTGYWPNAQGQIEVFIPDLNNRPHISLVMEVVPPELVYDNANSVYKAYTNAYGFPGFLNAQPSTGTLVKGAIELIDIDTTDVYIGNSVYIVDQFGGRSDPFEYIHDEFGSYIDIHGNILDNQTPGSPGFAGIANPIYGIPYADTGTVVSDINFNSIVLNKALLAGASYPDNRTYFNIYFCGNAYYTVQTSDIASQPYAPNLNILSANTDPYYQGPSTNQVTQHIDSINHLKSIVDQIINNTPVTPTTGNSTNQIFLPTVIGGSGAQAFIDLRFGYLTSIIGAANINAAESIVPSAQIAKTGTIPSGAGSAITLIQSNIDFMAAEVYAYVLYTYPAILNTSNYQYSKCRRDVGLILQQLIYDLETGGNYNMVYSGLSYWSRPGTYHVISLGEAVNDPTLFPDGSIVNFYQRSYISASGYVFEYVGAGSNYGALPQYGIADPIQKQETIQLNSGKVFFTSTDQNGDFRIGTNLVISQATGVISGRVFTQSLFANMTPFILAIQG